MPGERFDLIASNPPYLPAEDDELPDTGSARHIDAGLDGRVHDSGVLLLTKGA